MVKLMDLVPERKEKINSTKELISKLNVAAQFAIKNNVKRTAA